MSAEQETAREDGGQDGGQVKSMDIVKAVDSKRTNRARRLCDKHRQVDRTGWGDDVPSHLLHDASPCTRIATGRQFWRLVYKLAVRRSGLPTME